MKISRLICCSVTFAISCTLAHADWKVHPASEFEEEVRVWASDKERGLDFSWSGKVNGRHEAEGYGVLEWFKTEDDQRAASVIYTGEMKAGRRHGMGVSLLTQRGEILRPMERERQRGQGRVLVFERRLLRRFVSQRPYAWTRQIRFRGRNRLRRNVRGR